MDIHFTLAGANFRPKEAKDTIKELLNEGDTATLIRQSDNEWDERAVQVHFKDQFIGFVPKSDNLLLSQEMDACELANITFGYTCQCTGFAGTIQPTFLLQFDIGQEAALADVEDADESNHGDL